jgi:hypothetical protein
MEKRRIDGVKNVYLSLEYSRNNAGYLIKYKLVDDNFNSNISMDLDLKNLVSHWISNKRGYKFCQYQVKIESYSVYHHCPEQIARLE